MSSDECLGDLMKCDSYSRVAASGSFITIMEERPCHTLSSDEYANCESDGESTLDESSDESPKRAIKAAQPYDPFEYGDNGEVAIHHRAGLSAEGASTSSRHEWKQQGPEWSERCDEIASLAEFTEIVKHTDISIPWAGVTQSEGDLERYRRADKSNSITWEYTSSDCESPASSSSSSCGLEPIDEQKLMPTYPIKTKRRMSKIPRYRGNVEPRPGGAEHIRAGDFEVFTASEIEESPRKEPKSTFGDTKLSVRSGAESKEANKGSPTAKATVKPLKAEKGLVKSKKRRRYRVVTIKPIYKARSEVDITMNFKRDNPFEPICRDTQPQVVHSQTQTLGSLMVVDPMKSCRKSEITFATVGGDYTELRDSNSVGVIECAHTTSDGEQAKPPSFVKRSQKPFSAKSPRSNAVQVQPFATSSETHSSRENSPRRRRSCRATKTLYADLRSVLIRFLCFWMILLVCLALYHSANIQEYALNVYTALRNWYYPQKPPLTPRQKIAKGVKTILGLFKL